MDAPRSFFAVLRDAFRQTNAHSKAVYLSMKKETKTEACEVEWSLSVFFSRAVSDVVSRLSGIRSVCAPSGSRSR